LSDRSLDALLTIAPGRGAYVAVPEGHTEPVVAFGGFVHVPAEGSCEISVAVADAWQGVRLGTLLVLAAVEDARIHGFQRFHADVLGDNVRMLGLLRELTPASRTRVEAGVVRIDFELPESAGYCSPQG
jgi:acetyltransferase